MVVTDLLTSDKSPEGLILSVIKDNPNVSTKQIYNKITKQGISIRYHKVYEKVQDMVKRDVLVKTEKSYALNDVWVKRTTTFMETIQIKQLKDSTNGLFFGADNIRKVELLIFDSFKNYMKYVKSLKTNLINSLENKEIMWIANHSVISLLSLSERPLVSAEIKKKNIKYYSLLRGNTHLDKFLNKMNKDLGINNYKIGVNDGGQSIIGIYGDKMLYVIYPQHLIQKIEEFFQKTKNFDHEAFYEISEILNDTSKMHVIVIEEPYLVEGYKKYVKSQFPDKS